MVQKGFIVSVRVLYISLHRFKSFLVSGGGCGPESDYSVCLHPLRQFFRFSGFWVLGFMGFWVWAGLGYSNQLLTESFRDKFILILIVNNG